MNKVSVIVPVYNAERYIAETIESILNQSYKSIELIVIDDGSTDKTADILNDRFGTSIRYIYQNNNGGSSARNNGIKIARGEYIAFCDHDDMWATDKLKEQIELLNSNKEIGLVFCNLKVIDKNGIMVTSKKYTQEHKKNSLEMLLGGCFITTLSQVVMRRECFAEVGGFIERLKYSGDWELYIRVAKKYKFDFVDKYLVNYRTHDNNLTKNLDLQNSEFGNTLNIIWSDSLLKKKYYKVYKKIHHRMHYDLGVEYFDKGRMRDARLLFWRSLFFKPLRWSSMLFILKTTFAKKYLALRDLKRKCGYAKS